MLLTDGNLGQDDERRGVGTANGADVGQRVRAASQVFARQFALLA